MGKSKSARYICKILLKNQWNDDVLDILKKFVELDKTKRLYVSKMRD